jgi:hypothetical protein
VLKTLDILIGVATVMLLFSMVVTIVTQSILTALQTRGRNLRNGLAGLLKQLDPAIANKLATEISTALLRQPLISGKFGALGTVIHRDEFTTLLMEAATGQSSAKVTNQAKTAIVDLLQKNGVSDPAGALKNIRDVALQLEAANPQLNNSVRHSMAILQEAKSEYVAKVHGWFDQTIDRVSQRFTANAHGITFVVALVLAFSVQLDTIQLINRLSTDDAMRTYLADQAQGISNQAVDNGVVPRNADAGQNAGQPNTGGAGKPAASGDASTKKTGASAQRKKSSGAPAASPTPAPTPAATNPPGGGTSGTAGQGGGSADGQKDAQTKITALLKDNGLIVPPKWPFHWTWPLSTDLKREQLPGILVSALLLTLGAPFWYGVLQSLLKLRSSVAKKDDEQRARRQGTDQDSASQEGAAGAPDGDRTALPASFKGEQGDLQAVG